jgi:hypothetical protein
MIRILETVTTIQFNRAEFNVLCEVLRDAFSGPCNGLSDAEREVLAAMVADIEQHRKDYGS